ncbi:phosphoribosyl-AMP cyclohydrolase [Candidatus Nasuia deltocephalinicola]|uniref:phosphoribosyl-AMP cyclohydrolase n=1 Tax=Candidatus Nasuia deltocephalincola TaxID=1160784 RepID=UPI00216B4A7C|nr:phosphoribosyl-AMP cyclohydrolase [Candidatus Nasuia deltocephalinicola]
MKKFIINNLFFVSWNIFNLLTTLLLNIILKNIIMLAFLNYVNINKILLNNFLYYYSRNKLKYWFKGFKSKNFQLLNLYYIDCDMDFFFIYIFQYYKTTCHTNYLNCDINKINFLKF